MTLQELMDRNYEQGLEQGRAEGEADGIEKGRAEGEAAGLEKGLAEGETAGQAAATLKLARNFKNAGISAEVIAENTGLSLEEIEKL